MKTKSFSYKHLVVSGMALALFAVLWANTMASALPLGNPKIIINIPTRTLALMDGKKLIKKYPVGVGRKDFPTPLGEFKVIRMTKNPVWRNPLSKTKSVVPSGRSNPIGTRWIGFYRNNAGEYGIHGTDRPNSIGKYSSHGCVRMNMKDAEELFELVNMDTPVAVTYYLATISKKDQQVVLKVYPDIYKRGMPPVQQLHQQIVTIYPNASVDNKKLASAFKTVTPSGLPIAVGSLE